MESFYASWIHIVLPIWKCQKPRAHAQFRKKNQHKIETAFFKMGIKYTVCPKSSRTNPTEKGQVAWSIGKQWNYVERSLKLGPDERASSALCLKRAVCERRLITFFWCEHSARKERTTIYGAHHSRTYQRGPKDAFTLANKTLTNKRNE